MVLPQTYTVALMLMLLALLCQGSWANTLKLAGRQSWRFELYYFDFAIGLMAMALICGFTFGTMGFDGFSLMDDFVRAGKRQWLFGFLSGVLFNLANMLLAAAISLAGLAFAFPLAMGVTLMVIGVWLVGVIPHNSAFLIGGCLLILIAALLDAISYFRLAHQRHEAAVLGGKAKRGSSLGFVKPLILCIASGLLGGLSFPWLDWARAGEVGLGPYGAAVMFALGILFSTFVYNMFFMNLPVEGEPLELLEYFKGGLWVHRFGLLGGAIWCAGMVASFAVAAAPPEAQLGHAATLLFGNGGAVIAALWGLLVWNELAGAAGQVKKLVWLMLLLFACGLTLFSFAFQAGRG